MENDADLTAHGNHSEHAHGHHGHEAAAAHGDHGGMNHGMFFQARVAETILFEGWVVSRTEQLVGSCLLIFLLGVLFEALKHLRAHLLHAAARPGDPKGQRLPVASSEEVRVRPAPARLPFLARAVTRQHLAQTLLYVLQFVIGYLLMLVFMTYNVWLCLAVVAGIGTGFLLFGAAEHFPTASPAAEVQNGDCGCH